MDGSQAKLARTVDFKMEEREMVIRFVRRVAAERAERNIEPTNVPFILLSKEFGDGVSAVLDALCENGELVRCETVNSYSFNLKGK